MSVRFILDLKVIWSNNFYKCVPFRVWFLFREILIFVKPSIMLRHCILKCIKNAYLCLARYVWSYSGCIHVLEEGISPLCQWSLSPKKYFLYASLFTIRHYATYLFKRYLFYENYYSFHRSLAPIMNFRYDGKTHYIIQYFCSTIFPNLAIHFFLLWVYVLYHFQGTDNYLPSIR